MKSDEELWEVCLDIYNELYEEATPSADFSELKEEKLSKDADHDDPAPFKDYFLEEERQQEIIEKHTEDLSKPETRKVSVEVNLGCAPVGSKEAWRGEADESK